MLFPSVTCLNVLIILLCGEVATQEIVSETESPDVLSDVICTTCNCLDQYVDCTNRDIKQPFEITDWEGLKEFNPVTVNVSGNPMGSLTRIASLPIQTLNLSSCELESIEKASFTYLTELVTLDLSRNKISTATLSNRIFMGLITSDKGLLSFEKIRYLSLANNDIHSLPQDVFNFMTSLTVLDLSGNPLAFMDQVTMAALSELVNIRELYLSSCELESLPEGLFRRQRLIRRLDLSDNRFTTLPAVLNEAMNLNYLNVGKNPIQTLESENVLRNLTKLQELRMCRNSKLESIDASALGGLVNLVSLHICYNPRLTQVDQNFLVSLDDHGVETWPVLNELYMNNNNLSRLDSGFLHRWDKLEKSDFSNNPFKCDCHNKWVVEVLTPLLQENVAQNMICSKPPDLRGLSFYQLYNTSKELTCPENESLLDLPAPDMAVLLGVMIVSATIGGLQQEDNVVSAAPTHAETVEESFYSLSRMFVTFPLVLIIVLLWRKGYFQRCKSKYKDESDEEEMDAF